FFQAEDGIRDRNVTGVQTCALPIYCVPTCWAGPRVSFRPGGASHWPPRAQPPEGPHRAFAWRKSAAPGIRSGTEIFPWMPKPKRSEERRVGKEWRARGASAGEKKRR